MGRPRPARKWIGRIWARRGASSHARSGNVCREPDNHREKACDKRMRSREACQTDAPPCGESAAICPALPMITVVFASGFQPALLRLKSHRGCKACKHIGHVTRCCGRRPAMLCLVLGVSRG